MAHSARIYHELGASRLLQGVRVRGDELEAQAQERVQRVTGAVQRAGDYGWEPQALVVEVELAAGGAAASAALALEVVREAQNAYQVTVPRGAVRVTGLTEWELTGLGAAVDLRLAFAVDETPHEPSWGDALDLLDDEDASTLMNVGDTASSWSATSSPEGEGIGLAFRLARPLLVFALGLHRNFTTLAAGTYRARLWDTEARALLANVLLGPEGSTRTVNELGPPYPRLTPGRRYALVVAGHDTGGAQMGYETMAPAVSVGSRWVFTPEARPSDDGAFIARGLRLESGTVREPEPEAMPGATQPQEPLRAHPLLMRGAFV